MPKHKTFMKQKFQLLFLLCIMALGASAQKDTSASLNIGDNAPRLRVSKWIKGTQGEIFEKGKIYVIDFWATWCGPCIAAMPHLSYLAHKYKHKAVFLAIDVYEGHVTKTRSTAQIKDFVSSMGRKMYFNVAVEDSNFTVHQWLDASNEKSIPTTFVIDGEGRVAWIGHPHELDTVLRRIVDNTWDIKAALTKRDIDDQWEKSDMEVINKVQRYQGRYDHLEDLGNPDSTLFVIDEMVKKEPDLKYTPWMVSYTFSALLRTDPSKAYKFGKQAMTTATYGLPAWNMIIGDIRDDSRKIHLPAEIYLLGAECHQAEIDHVIYPELVNMSKKYQEMAAWYKLAGEKSKAIKAEKKAIKFYRKMI